MNLLHRPHHALGKSRIESLKRLILLPLAWLLLVIPALATEYDIDPLNPVTPPHIQLPPDELARLQTLLSAVYPSFQSDLSPDNRALEVWDSLNGLYFLDTQTGARQPISQDLLNLWWLTERRWSDKQTMTFVGSPDGTTPWLVTVDRSNGAFTTQVLNLPGYPVSLSVTGRKLLLVRTSATVAPMARAVGVPIRTVPLRPRFSNSRSSPPFDVEQKYLLRVATIDVDYVVYDLMTQTEQALFSVPQDTALASIAWAPNDQQIALVRWKWPNNTRGGGIPDDDPGVLDGLGRLDPHDNPFFMSNVFDLFDLSKKKVRHVDVHPPLVPREVFIWAGWSTDSQTVVTQLWRPSLLEGREYPTYANPDLSLYRFYSPDGRPLRTLRDPKVNAAYMWGPFFTSADEVFLFVPSGLGWSLYSYSLSSGRLRNLPVPEGALYEMAVTNGSREVIYMMGSFKNPPEVYRIGPWSDEPRQITHLNDTIRATNKVRVDKVSFSLENGVSEGRLIQPKGATFPPHKVPIIVWQNGGPTSFMGNDWLSSSEAPIAVLANFGFAVLVVPLEGRTNLGPERLDALVDGKNFGQIDVDEQVEIARQMIRWGWTKPDRLGIAGMSYGGYFVSQSITQHPDVYAAANAHCSLLDAFNEWDYGYKSWFAYLEGRTPSEDWPEWERDSPVYNASSVRTPTLIFDGTEDFLPYQRSQDFYNGIGAAGTTTDFYLFEGEDHGFSFLSSQLVATQAQIEWFRRFLKTN